MFEICGGNVHFECFLLVQFFNIERLGDKKLQGF